MITSWTEIYPPGQLLVVSQEKALARPRGVSRDYDPPSITLLQAETNLAPKIQMPHDVAEYLEAMFAAERDRLRDVLGDSTSVYAKD